MTSSVRLPKKISIKCHTQMRPNLKPEFKAGGLTIHLGLSYIQKWRIRLEEVVRNNVDNVVEAVMQYVKVFKPMENWPSDVGFM
jgi:hypothetical protein